MNNSGSILVKAILVLAIAAILFALTNSWLLFGVTAWSLMMLGLAVGFGAQLSQKPIPILIVGLLVVYIVLLTAIALLDNPRQPLTLILGFPAATAVLVYGIWPVATVIGLVYALTFDRTVLPPDRLDEFIRRFGRKDPQA
ncbi:MAG: hypothetical protein CMN58_01985 [Solibacterales bacterium]|nr:hypothetical protein [Bryobacterales bacterium]|tara:strand:- start:3464 stop:3886 length:423 start_codon:yes stop_codon:yes gene_type:complete